MNEIIEIKRQQTISFDNKFVEFIEDELNDEFSAGKIQLVSKAVESADLFVLVEEVKTAIHQLIYQNGVNSNQDIPDYISEKVKSNYIFLNNLFLQSTGFTIDRYINTKKIELIKEILIYDELDIETIACKLNYQNATHFVEEFRKETGVSPSFYRLLRKTSSYEYQNV